MRWWLISKRHRALGLRCISHHFHHRFHLLLQYLDPLGLVDYNLRQFFGLEQGMGQPFLKWDDFIYLFHVKWIRPSSPPFNENRNAAAVTLSYKPNRAKGVRN